MQRGSTPSGAKAGGPAQGEESKRMHLGDAAEYRETQRRFAERAAVAKGGMLLVDTSDAKFMLENQRVISRACTEHRVRFVGQPGERGPLPVEPGVEVAGLPGYSLGKRK